MDNKHIVTLLVKIAENPRVSFSDRWEAVAAAESIYRRCRKSWSYFFEEGQTPDIIREKIVEQTTFAVAAGYGDNNLWSYNFHDIIVATKIAG